ncbi:MAG: hypothetical protein CMF48_03455 [Legionellales bacterium]|nr:hypothetical protein [Legionellales bacterium]|tara:strand:- start:76 stop:441 length:366 start_codon:yes stop_codon:yes gene_type:complete
MHFGFLDLLRESLYGPKPTAQQHLKEIHRACAKECSAYLPPLLRQRLKHLQRISSSIEEPVRGTTDNQGPFQGPAKARLEKACDYLQFMIQMERDCYYRKSFDALFNEHCPKKKRFSPPRP